MDGLSSFYVYKFPSIFKIIDEMSALVDQLYLGPRAVFYLLAPFATGLIGLFKKSKSESEIVQRVKL